LPANWHGRLGRLVGITPAHKVLACPAIRLKLTSLPLATNPGVSE